MSMNNLEQTETNKKETEDLPQSSQPKNRGDSNESSVTYHGRGVSSYDGDVEKGASVPPMGTADADADAYAEKVRRKKELEKDLEQGSKFAGPTNRSTTFAERLKEKMELEKSSKFAAPTKRSTFDERLKEKMELENSSKFAAATKRSTFDERLEKKMKIDEKLNDCESQQRSPSKFAAATKLSTFDERLEKKMKIDGAGNTTSRITFDDRLAQKMRSTGEGTGGKGYRDAFEQREKCKLENLRGGEVTTNSQDSQDCDKPNIETTEHTLCSEGNQTIDTASCAPTEIEGNQCTNEQSISVNQFIMDAKVQAVQPMVSDEDGISPPVVSKFDFSDVLLDLQRFKEINGDVAVPVSHPLVSLHIQKLSSHEMAPFVIKCGRCDSRAAIERQGTRRRMKRRSLLGSTLGRLLHGHSSVVLLRATLVEEEEGEVAIAVPVGVFAQRWKPLALTMCILLTVLAVLLFLTLTNVIDMRGEAVLESGGFQPTSSPTLDPRSTLEIIQSRGHVLCGMEFNVGFYMQLCRAVAAVVVGSSEKIKLVPITTSNRWQQLDDRNVDILLNGDTHTIEREVRESSTGKGFVFSSPFNYDGMAYFGTQTFVHCAEEHKRYDHCSNLKICVSLSTTHHAFLKALFPSDNIVAVLERNETRALLFNGTCNVAASDKSFFDFLSDGSNGKGYVTGRKLLTKEPLAIVTRNSDSEFSDIVNWVLQALFYGEEQGFTKNSSLCQNDPDPFFNTVTDLRFLNAVHCVGNYGDILGFGPNDWGMNQINNGSTGMLYATPFGEIDKDNNRSPAAGGKLAKIRKEESIKCGVVVPDSFEGNVTESNKLVGMSVDYCQALAAALFHGDPRGVEFLTFPESDSSSFVALANGTIDVLVGGRVQRKYDFRSQSLEGFHFSTPYYYGNEAASDDVSFFSIATHDHKDDPDDILFSSFVNCIVTATIYAQENGIQREKSNEMPLVTLFGNELRWALRDAINYGGSYDEIYMENFGSGVPKEDRGRNTLNEGGPMMHSFPHLSLDDSEPT